MLNKLPKSVQTKAKDDLHQFWMADTRESACKAFDGFLEKYGPHYDAAYRCLRKDKDMRLTSYDFPVEHCIRLRHHHRLGPAPPNDDLKTRRPAAITATAPHPFI